MLAMITPFQPSLRDGNKYTAMRRGWCRDSINTSIKMPVYRHTPLRGYKTNPHNPFIAQHFPDGGRGIHPTRASPRLVRIASRCHDGSRGIYPTDDGIYPTEHGMHHTPNPSRRVATLDPGRHRRAIHAMSPRPESRRGRRMSRVWRRLWIWATSACS